MRQRAIRSLSAMMIIMSMVAIAALRAHAQVPGTDTLRLSWDDVPSRVSASPDVLRARIDIARARAERQRTSFFPSLPELESTYDTDAPFEAEGERAWEIGISQEIELGGQYFLRRRAADAGVARAELEARAVEIDVRAEARRAYARLAAAEAHARLLDTLIGFSRRLDTIAARLLAAGEISELDRNSVAIERGRGEIERLDVETEAAEAGSELRRLLDLGSTILTTASDEMIGDPTASIARALEVERSLAAGDDAVLRSRPDWQALDQDAERARAERSLASRLWVPDVRLGAAIGSERTILGAENLVGASDAVRSGFGTYRSEGRHLGLRFNIDIPLPFGGLYDLGSGDAAIADAELAAVDVRRRALAGRIRADVASAAARLRNAAAAYSIAARQMAPLVTRNLDLLERGYREGELGAAEVVAQQQQFIRAGEASIAARRAYSEALADFERAIAQ